jgi:hypothetical protein
MPITQFPHCDPRILHGPHDRCEYCDRHPEWQALRQAWGIAFTGHRPASELPECGYRARPSSPAAGFTCRQRAGHEGDHLPVPEWEQLPCPADAARPPGAGNDHRRWGGNKPTTAEGDPSWPAESAASAALYGDKGGQRAPG